MGGRIILKTPDEIEAMRRSGRLLAAVFSLLGELVKPGVKSIELDRAAESFIRDHGGSPSFKGYRGFPASICTSFNEQVVHGIPCERRLTEGDLLGIDCGVLLDGYHADMAISYWVGGDKPPKAVWKLMKTTMEALRAGIGKAKPGVRLGDISNAVQTTVERKGFSAVRALVGHGIGRRMHEEPQVPNFGRAGDGPVLEEGMTLAIEPMINQGKFQVRQLEDGWTIVTADGKLSCHFEHTIAVTAGGPVILTQP